MRLLVVWAGIVAFAWIALDPPMTSETATGGPRRGRVDQVIDVPVLRQVDTGRLLGRLLAVVALTGGLLYTEARLMPWLRRALRNTAAAGTSPVPDSLPASVAPRESQ